MATEPSQRVVPPVLLARPADVPPPLDPLRDASAIRSLHSEWARLHGAPATPVTQWKRVTRKLRQTLALGSTDRELIGALIRGVDLIAARCDEIADRLAATEVLTSEVTNSFGRDITHVRADLMTMRAALDQTHPGQ